MKLSISFIIILLLAVAFLPIASSALTEDVPDSPTGPVSRLTPSQKDALKVLAFDDETHKKIVDRADPLKVTKFMEIRELFKKKEATENTETASEEEIESSETESEEEVESTETENGESTVKYMREVFDIAIAYVPCEIAWHLRIIEFDETVQCLENSASWKARTKVGDQMLVNFFADKHAFELIQLLKTTDVGDEELFLNIRKMLSSEGFHASISSAFFLQHALALHKEDPKSSERQEMVKNLLSLHLSAIATEFYNRKPLEALYTELAQTVPTLLSGGSSSHAIAIVATHHTKEDKYDIVIVNSGDGIENHENTTEIQPKGFHTGASYDHVSTEPGKLIKATSYNPLLWMERVTGAQLASSHYHSGKMDQVYYVKKNASSLVVTEALMSWEWTEAQGIGTCTVTSIWFALHFYYQALGYENEIRLSMLDQAIGDLMELQDKVEDLERQINADYHKAREAFRKTHKKTVYFPYDQDRVKDLKLKKDKAEKSLHLRRTIISMALNEILRNMIVWKHELSDIKADLLTKDKDEEFVKMEHRQKVLEKAISQSVASFHSFWALQEEKYLKRQGKIAGTEAALLSSALDSWQSIREDVRTMYNDAIRMTGIKPTFATVLAKKAIVNRTFKPINVTSLKEYASLRKILRYIINFGDSPALRGAISRHLRVHAKNADAAKYLIVLYACLAKNVPLLDHLVVAQELPLLYTIDTAKGDTSVSMYWDLTTEDSIAALAAHEFAQHGQPLDVFPELFRMSKKETQDIVGSFKDTYNEIAPIINAHYPSQDDVDEAFKDFVKQGRIAVIAYILPKTSEKAIGDAFLKTENIRVLHLLIDMVQNSKLLEQKMEKSIKEDNAGIVEFILPFHLRYEKRATERDLIKKKKSGSAATGKPAVASFTDVLLNVAYDRDAVKITELLAPFANESAIKDLVSKAATSGKSEMAQALSKYAADGAIFAAIEKANKQGHVDLARALFEEYARKKPAEAMFLKAAEQGDLYELEKLMLSVTADTIGYALFKAAQKGKMDCFGKLVPHSTDISISAALFKVSDENLNDHSVLKAVNNASRLLVYKEITDRATKASNVKLVVHMLPFMSTAEVNRFFEVACKNAKSFEITKQLLQFADSDSVDYCLKIAVDEKMDDNVIILLPYANREELAKISRSSKFERLDDGTQRAVTDRINSFPTEIAIELAFLPDDKDDTRGALQTELEEYAKSRKDMAGPACSNLETCIAELEKNRATLVFPVGQAIERLSERAEDNTALEMLLPFATPDACAQIVSHFSEHGSEEAIKACAAKALRAEVSRTARSVKDEKEFKLIKLLAPFVSPLEMVKMLELDSSKEINVKRAEALLADLPSDLADDALRVAVRGSEGKREESVHYLLPKASKAAIDEAHLFAKRIEFDDEPLEKAASDKAKAQGAEIEKALQA